MPVTHTQAHAHTDTDTHTHTQTRLTKWASSCSVLFFSLRLWFSLVVLAICLALSFSFWHTHTHTHTYTHTHTHTHTQIYTRAHTLVHMLTQNYKHCTVSLRFEERKNSEQGYRMFWTSGYCTAKIFRQRKFSSKATVRQFVRNLFSSNGSLVLSSVVRFACLSVIFTFMTVSDPTLVVLRKI